MGSALIGASLIALSPLFVRFSEVGSTATAFYRFFFALPFVWAWMVFENTHSPDPRTPRTRRDYCLMILAGLFLGLDISLWHLSMLKTSVVNSILLNGMTPVIVAVLAWVFFKEKITLPLIAGIILALGGSFLLVSGKQDGGAANLEGDFYALTSAFFYAGFILCVKTLRQTFATPTILFWVSLAGMYVLGLNAFFMNETLVPASGKGWLLLLCLSLVVHILGSGLMNYSMGHLSATASSLTILIGPFVAALIGWIIFNEELTLAHTLGGLTILIGIVLSRQTSLTFSSKKKTTIKTP
jgi:drug/metabolite transporter (DMT)-like permease